MNKQILAALEIVDGDLRLIVGEFYNTRFHIIKAIESKTLGIEQSTIINRDLVTYDLKKLFSKAQSALEVSINKVILCIPSKNVARYPLKVKVNIENSDSRIKLEDIQRGYKLASNMEVDKTRTLINQVCSKYYINGISTRKLPLNEKCDELTMDIDLLYADSAITYEYVKVVESSNVEVLDIYLDSFAACKEAALLENSMNQNIIIVKLENSTTGLTILTEGRFVSSKQIKQGLDTIVECASKQFQLKKDIISKLIYYNVDLFSEEHSNSPIHLWSEKNVTHELSEKQLYDCIEKPLNDLKKSLEDILKPVIEIKDTRIIIVGQGAELQGFDKVLNKVLKCKVENYIPETLGTRNGSYVSTLGSLYAYKDNYSKSNDASSVDLIEYQEVLNKIKIEDVEQSVTTKLKNIFEKRKENLDNESRI